jgi:hypothetical protein
MAAVARTRAWAARDSEVSRVVVRSPAVQCSPAAVRSPEVASKEAVVRYLAVVRNPVAVCYPVAVRNPVARGRSGPGWVRVRA